MILKRNQQIFNFVIYISFLLIMLCKSSCCQSCLDYCLGWRSIILLEVFSVMASYGKGMSICILEDLCHSLLWRVLGVHLIIHTCNTLSNTLAATPQYHIDVCWHMFNACRYRHSSPSNRQNHTVTHFL